MRLCNFVLKDLLADYAEIRSAPGDFVTYDLDDVLRPVHPKRASSLINEGEKFRVATEATWYSSHKKRVVSKGDNVKKNYAESCCKASENIIHLSTR